MGTTEIKPDKTRLMLTVRGNYRDIKEQQEELKDSWRCEHCTEGVGQRDDLIGPDKIMGGDDEEWFSMGDMMFL